MVTSMLNYLITMTILIKYHGYKLSYYWVILKSPWLNRKVNGCMFRNYKLIGFMDQEGRIQTSKVIYIKHYHGNIKYSNHGNGTQPNKYFKTFKKHRINDHLLNLIFIYWPSFAGCYILWMLSILFEVYFILWMLYAYIERYTS